jgi:hypothetical protein
MKVKVTLLFSVCIISLAVATLASACKPQAADSKGHDSEVQEQVGAVALVPQIVVPTPQDEEVALEQPAAHQEANNNSYTTPCAEESNVNIPIFGPHTTRFQIVATHPSYGIGKDSCDPDVSGCPTPTPGPTPLPDLCAKVYDDGINVVRVCTAANWWRPSTMTVTVSGQPIDGHYLELYRKIPGANEWPGFFVLYEDGNTRLIPHPPEGRSQVCYGSSVIVGSALEVESKRPYANVQEVRVDPSSMSLDITYRDGGTAHVELFVDRTRAVASVDVNYPTSAAIPFATFRSMYVADGNADVDHIETPSGNYPILGEWTTLEGSWWIFHRKVQSDHHTSAPDIRIEVSDAE